MAARRLIITIIFCAAALFFFSVNVARPGEKPASTYKPHLGKIGCVAGDCHQVENAAWHKDIHYESELDCHDCHGGNPYALAEEDAHNDWTDVNQKKRDFSWSGKPSRREIPNFCDKCHGDADFMKIYTPKRPRFDQYKLYLTSVHGKKWLEGDTKIAVCTDCHAPFDNEKKTSVPHQIHAIDDPTGPTYFQRIPQTCDHCHGDAEYMKDRKIFGTSKQLPTDQLTRYRTSNHAKRVETGDSGAPNCVTCHGAHAAEPPQVAKVKFICRSCHPKQTKYFRASVHDEEIEDECIECHNNHDIRKATLGVEKEDTCSECHEPDDEDMKAGYDFAQTFAHKFRGFEKKYDEAKELHEQADVKGMAIWKISENLRDAHDDFLKSRTAIHRFQTGEVEKFFKPAAGSLRKAEKEARNALKEYRKRRAAFVIFLIIGLLLAAGLFLKIRRTTPTAPDV